MSEQNESLGTEDQFVIQSKVTMGLILNFDPTVYFQEWNPVGVRMIIRDSFRDCFLQRAESVSLLYPRIVTGLKPKYPALVDDLVINALGENAYFELAHIFHLLANQPIDDRALLKEAMNYFYILTSEGSKRGFALYVPAEGKWMLGADDVNTNLHCRGADQVLAYLS